MPRREQPSISTIPPTPNQDKAGKGDFDSEDNPDVKEQFLSMRTSKPPPPRKLRGKIFKADRGQSPTTEDSFTADTETLTESQDGNVIDGNFGHRKKRPHSGVVAIDPTLSMDQIAQLYVTVRDERNQLTKVKVNLEKQSELDAIEIEKLKETLDLIVKAKDKLEPRTKKAEKELTDLQDTHHEVLSRNKELERLNKVFKREATQATNSEERLRALQQTVVNQLSNLNETLLKKENRIGQLEDEKDTLIKAREALESDTVGARDVQQLLIDQNLIIANLTDENSALRRDREGIRSEVEKYKEEKELAKEFWRTEESRTIDRELSYESMQGSWNQTVIGQPSRSQTPVSSPAITNTTTHSPPGLASSQEKTLRKIKDVKINGGRDLNDVTKSDSVNQEEATYGLLPLRGLGIDVHPPTAEFNTLQVGEASTRTPAIYASAQTQIDASVITVATTDAATQVKGPLGVNKTIKKSTYLDTGVQTEPATSGDEEEKLPYIDGEVQPSPREVFEIIRPVTFIDEPNIILPSTTYVDSGVQTSPTELVEKGVQIDSKGGPPQELLRRSTFVDAGLQKDPAQVEVLREITSKYPINAPYASRVREQTLLNLLDPVLGDPAPSSSEVSREKLTAILKRTSSSESKSAYKIVGSRPKDSQKSTRGDGSTPGSDVITNAPDPVVRDFAFEANAEGLNGREAPEEPVLPNFPISAKNESRNKPGLPLGSGEESTIMHDFSVQAKPLPGSATASVPVENKDTQRHTFNSNVSRIRSIPPSGHNPARSIKTFTLPHRSKEFEERARSSDASVTDQEGGGGHEERAISSEGKNAIPWWWYATVGVVVSVVLTHAFFEEKRFWRNANELTRHAVIAMRDERWESDWFHKIGYTLDQKLSIDMTGFC